MEHKEYLTKEKFKELTEELVYLKTTKRGEIAKELDQTGSMGDLRENAEYHQARESQAELEQRIMQLENILKDVVVVDGGSKNEVGIGGTVVLTKQGQKDKVEYKIVGAEEANMSEGKISVRSPLVQAMLRKKKGEEFSFTAPNGSLMRYKIENIK
ncbi:transcription elongation factor GreA [Patescibacteria group bacterium]|nr:transcription elongation factor GreA [Patescibacteria group bacterium]